MFVQTTMHGFLDLKRMFEGRKSLNDYHMIRKLSSMTAIQNMNKIDEIGESPKHQNVKL